MLLTERLHLFDDAGGVLYRERVRHGEDGREAANRCGARTGEHRLALFEARLAKMGVEVDEPWQRYETGGVDALATRDLVDEHAVVDEQILRGSVRQSCPGDGDAHERTSREVEGALPESR